MKVYTEQTFVDQATGEIIPKHLVTNKQYYVIDTYTKYEKHENHIRKAIYYYCERERQQQLEFGYSGTVHKNRS